MGRDGEKIADCKMGFRMLYFNNKDSLYLNMLNVCLVSDRTDGVRVVNTTAFDVLTPSKDYSDDYLRNLFKNNIEKYLGSQSLLVNSVSMTFAKDSASLEDMMKKYINGGLDVNSNEYRAYQMAMDFADGLGRNAKDILAEGAFPKDQVFVGIQPAGIWGGN